MKINNYHIVRLFQYFIIFTQLSACAAFTSPQWAYQKEITAKWNKGSYTTEHNGQEYLLAKVSDEFIDLKKIQEDTLTTSYDRFVPPKRSAGEKWRAGLRLSNRFGVFKQKLNLPPPPNHSIFVDKTISTNESTIIYIIPLYSLPSDIGMIIREKIVSIKSGNGWINFHSEYHEMLHRSVIENFSDNDKKAFNERADKSVTYYPENLIKALKN